MATKKQIEEALGDLLCNHSLGFFELEKNGELRHVWRVTDHFTGRVAGENVNPRIALQQARKCQEG